jgi:hypothetical protein
MLTTEFLLYLVTVIFAVFLIMHYNKEDNQSPKIEYRYIQAPNSENNRPNNRSEDNHSTGSGMNRRGQNGQNSRRRRAHDINVNITGEEGGFGMPPIDPLREFDYDAVYDDFTPPFRRSYYDDALLPAGLLPTYTRGPPGRFRKVGLLVAQGVSHNDKYKFLNVMGRERYPGRDFEYYVQSVDADSKLKIYLDTRRNELTCGEHVNIPDLSGYDYVFKEDKDLSPLYDPYFI